MFGRKLGPATGNAMGEIYGKKVGTAVATGIQYPVKIYGKPEPFISGGSRVTTRSLGTMETKVFVGDEGANARARQTGQRRASPNARVRTSPASRVIGRASSPARHRAALARPHGRRSDSHPGRG